MDKYERRGYLLENFRLFHLRSEGGTRVDFHYHEFCKLLLLVSGQGGYYVDGQHYLLRPGDIVMIGSKSIHRPELEETQPYERIIIYISPEYLRRMSAPDCDLLSLFSGENGHVLRPQEPLRRKLFRFAAQLERELGRAAFGREIASGAELLRLLVEIGRGMEDSSSALPDPATPENRRISELLRYLEAHITEEIDIDRLADAFYISKFYMMRLFRKETGTTIYAYLTQRRLMLAREQMAAGMSATDACYSSGFHSYSSFTRAYGKYFGTTPTGRTEGRLIREEDFE